MTWHLLLVRAFFRMEQHESMLLGTRACHHQHQLRRVDGKWKGFIIPKSVCRLAPPSKKNEFWLVTCRLRSTSLRRIASESNNATTQQPPTTLCSIPPLALVHVHRSPIIIGNDHKEQNSVVL